MRAIAGPALAAALLLSVAFSAPALARHAAPTPSPSPTPVADPTVTRLARQQFVAWQAGSVNRAQYAAGVQVKLTDAKIADTSHALAQLGALLDVAYIGPLLSEGQPQGTNGYIYQMRCASGSVYQFMVLDADGKITSIFFRDRLDTETVKVSPPPSP